MARKTKDKNQKRINDAAEEAKRIIALAAEEAKKLIALAVQQNRPPAEQTLEFMEYQKGVNETQVITNKQICEDNLRVHIALFGDGGSDKGMKAEFKEVYRVVVMSQGATKFFTRFMGAIIGLIGATCAAWWVVKDIIKHAR